MQMMTVANRISTKQSLVSKEYQILRTIKTPYHFVLEKKENLEILALWISYFAGNLHNKAPKDQKEIAYHWPTLSLSLSINKTSAQTHTHTFRTYIHTQNMFILSLHTHKNTLILMFYTFALARHSPPHDKSSSQEKPKRSVIFVSYYEHTVSKKANL